MKMKDEKWSIAILLVYTKKLFLIYLFIRMVFLFFKSKSKLRKMKKKYLMTKSQYEKYIRMINKEIFTFFREIGKKWTWEKRKRKIQLQSYCYISRINAITIFPFTIKRTDNKKKNEINCRCLLHHFHHHFFCHSPFFLF